ncbi:uncharacterized protein LOC117173510 [Belonocnema kinseyi]|uniref:uncharacterized protein LOC117173510 n=1 Tax=Belonocnema kinseyi TaxID=2817044 RepID=UPI00143D0579|nr:uncharacterized protein LOC117173510 [Belonocnema kinseyi]
MESASPSASKPTPAPYGIVPGCYVSMYLKGRGVLVGELYAPPEQEDRIGDRFYVMLPNGNLLLAKLQLIKTPKKSNLKESRYFIQVGPDRFVSELLQNVQIDNPGRVMLTRRFSDEPNRILFLWGTLGYLLPDAAPPVWARNIYPRHYKKEN